LGAWRLQGVSDGASTSQSTSETAQAWPPVIDDAPRPEGYYAYVRFDSDNIFRNRDLPAVYLDRAKYQRACFSGRVQGHLKHIIVATDFGRVTMYDPATDANWVINGCSDALIMESEVLTTREYWQTRLKLLPDTPANSTDRKVISQKIRGLRPWFWLDFLP
jgi:hypothetical protein